MDGFMCLPEEGGDEKAAGLQWTQVKHAGNSRAVRP